jgi:hypothetical protein
MSYQTQMDELARARERLLARCAEQREGLAQQVHEWRVPLTLTDRVWAGVQFLRNHPALLVGIAAALLTFRTRSLWSALKRGFVLWRTLRALSTRSVYLSNLLSRFAAR